MATFKRSVDGRRPATEIILLSGARLQSCRFSARKAWRHNLDMTISFERIKQRMAPLIDQWRQEKGPGGSVVVTVEDETILAEAFGLADIERVRPFTCDTSFAIASVTKQMTGLLVLMLEREGAIRLDAPALNYLNDFSDLPEDISIRDLCRHRTGLWDHIHLAILMGGWLRDEIDNQKIHALIKRLSFQMSASGECYSYSNSNYALLTWIIESVAGATFEELCARKLFAPLQMGATQIWRRAGSAPAASALGYVCGERGNYEPVNAKIDASGYGGAWSTANDMALWLRNFAADRLNFGDVSMVLAGITPLNAQLTESYGFGLVSKRDREGRLHVAHSGALPGCQSELAYFPDEKAGVFLHFNQDGGELQSDSALDLILDAVFGRAGARTARLKESGSPAPIADGLYINERLGLGIAAASDHETPRLILLGQDVSALLMDEEEWLQRSSPNAVIASRDASGVAALRLHAESLNVKNVECVLDASRLLEADECAGQYRCAMLGIDMDIVAAGQSLTAHLRGPFSWENRISLRRAAGNLFMIDGLSHGRGSAYFRLDAGGRLKEVLVCCNSALGVCFQRLT